MKMKLLTLTLHCRQSVEVIDISSQITYIHGQISAGKSSILRSIDYCFGGHIEKTPAISQELISIQLLAIIGKNKVLFERQITDKNEVRVTWQNELGENVSLLVPITLTATSKPIWNDNIYNLSDLLFYLLRMTPIKVRRSKFDEESPLIRLSFRDIMWYCYLPQDTIDSSFYHLEDPFRRLKSRDAIRFIIGFYTERMNELEIKIDEIKKAYLGKEESAKQIRSFLENFGYGTETDIANEIGLTEEELKIAKIELSKIRNEHRDTTHFADDLRAELRGLSDHLAVEEETLEILRERINEQESLKAELVSSKFKLARAEGASSVLSGVKFEFCPACGVQLENAPKNEETCQLCGCHPKAEDETIASQAEIISRDLISRIDDLTESIERHRKALSGQERIVAEIKGKKASLDARLTIELTDYDSAFMARFRELERCVATLEEKKRGFDKVVKMPQAITQLRKEALELRNEAEELAGQIQIEISKLAEAETLVSEIEEAYLESLIKVGVPGITKGDKVQISRRTWMPSIIPLDGDAYTFYDAGSLGKKTLLNSCYAMSVHKVAEENQLPMPTLLMIDTPMKNIGEDVNKDIFKAFYQYLYELANTSLSETQFIIIDKEFFPPDPNLNITVVDRFMSPDNPLISYYRGP